MINKPLISFCLLASLSGCGSGGSGSGIEFIEVSPTRMVELFQAPVLGYAQRSTPGSGKVYLLPYEFYGNDKCYRFIIDHELEHIDKGNVHSPGQQFKMPNECFDASVAIWKIYKQVDP